MIQVELQLLGGRGASMIKNSGEKLISDYLSNSKGRVIPINASRYGAMLEAEGSIRNLKRERALLYEDIAVSPTAAFQGDEHGVAMPQQLLNKNISLTHNHPDNRFGGTFSFADLNTHTSKNLKLTRAAAKEGTYYLKATEKSRPIDLNKRVAKDIPMLNNRMNKANTNLSNKVKSGKLTYRQAQRMLRQIVVGELHKYYKRIAPQYGYVYGRQKLNKTYR